MKQVINFKKYPNRKLYNQVKTEYQNQSDLIEYLLAGHPVTITENVTKQDITHKYLAGILGRLYQAQIMNEIRDKTAGDLLDAVQDMLTRIDSDVFARIGTPHNLEMSANRERRQQITGLDKRVAG
jgi:Uncharacterized protein conserved in bacteria